MDGLFVRVLGPIRAECRGRAIPLGSPQCKAVLAVLVVRRNELVSVEQLIHSLWADAVPASARAQVQSRICTLRTAVRRGGIADEVLATVRGGYQLRLPEGGLDVDLFHAALATAEDHQRCGRAGEASAVLRQALAGWPGDAYADVDLAITRQAATHLANLRLLAVERWVEAELGAGSAGPLVADLSRLVAEHPYHERLRGHLMRALVGSGRSAEALAVYRAGRRQLVEELGVEPSEELQDLHRCILGGRLVLTSKP
jgi:DNA-binding SARP family transcriptional activator